MPSIPICRLTLQRLAVLFVAAFGSLPCWSQSPYSGLPFARTFQSDTYNGGIQNYDFAQDTRGLLYVANNFGLLEYDGDHWRNLGVKTGTKVRSVAIDGRGRIYVGSQGDFGYFFPNANGELVYTSLADSLEERYRNFDETWNVFIDRDKVYFCTFFSIFIYDGKSFQVIPVANAIDLSFMVNGQLYVNERNIGIGILDGTKLNTIKGGELFGKFSVSSIIPLYTDELLVSTFQHGIFRLKDGQMQPWNERNQKLFEEANINCMIRLHNGQFAAGTQNNGLLVMDIAGNPILQMTRDRGLENRTILSLREDDLNNLWVGQNNVIAYVELGSPFTFISEQSGLPGTGYAAYLNEDNLYLGTNTGLYLKKKNRPDTFAIINNTRGQVYHIGHYNGDLLVGHHNGALRMENNKASPISSEQGSWLFLPLRDDSQKLIEGTYKGLQLYTLDHGHWKFVKKMKGFDESSRIMAEDHDGNIWVTHGYKGAFRITLNDARDSILKVSFYGDKKGFPSSRLINVFKIRNELLFTGENGVYKYDSSTDAFVPDGLFSTKLGQGAQFWFIQEDAMGNIYFIGREHIGVFRKNSLGDFTLHADEFNKIRKHLNDDLENITILKNDEVLFGGKEGFIHYNPAFQYGRRPAFSTLIRTVTSTHNGDSTLFSGAYNNGDSVLNRQLDSFKPSLPFESNSINFTFAAIAYQGDADLVYQYYLENYEKEWSAWSTKTFRDYTNLREKRYIFHVRAKNVNGEVSTEATYAFRVFPPWQRSPWAYAIYILSGMAILFAAFSVLDRKYKRQEQRNVETQEKVLNEKEDELEKLSVQSQEEINRLQNEKLESELHHMKNELATATMHLLNKTEFITGIKTELNQIVKKSAQDDLKKDLQNISKDIEKNISDDSDWEHFQFHFDRVHGDFTKRLKAAFTMLSPQETRLSAYLRMNLSSKEIAQLLNISVRGVEISRYRLRKKLLLDRNQNLQEFILNF